MSKKKSEPLDVEIPLLLRSKTFMEAWALFVQHRIEIRDSLTPTAARMQLKKLEKIGVERAVIAIEHSVSNGWKGIFEPKNEGVLDKVARVVSKSARRTGW